MIEQGEQRENLWLKRTWSLPTLNLVFIGLSLLDSQNTPALYCSGLRQSRDKDHKINP